jgi:hypothetical protein
MLPILIVFHARTAFDSRLRQLALFHNLLVITGPKFAAISKEQPAGQFMPRFAAIELQLYPAPNFLVVDVAQYENRFDDPAERRQCFSGRMRIILLSKFGETNGQYLCLGDRNF